MRENVPITVKIKKKAKEIKDVSCRDIYCKYIHVHVDKIGQTPTGENKW